MYLINESILKNKAMEISKDGNISVYELENLLKFSLEQNTHGAVEYAKSILKKNSYIIRKWTHLMELDASECEEMEKKGLSKECYDCSCSVCLIQ